MKTNETEKYEKYGSFFWMLLGLAGVALPLVLGLGSSFSGGSFSGAMVLPMILMDFIVVWVIILSLIAYGKFTGPFVRKTAEQAASCPYAFDHSFTSRNGILYISVKDGMIGFIAAYNPKKFQLFSAARLKNIKAADTLFLFELDGEKIVIPTLLTNRMSGSRTKAGREAAENSRVYAELLKQAAANAARD